MSVHSQNSNRLFTQSHIFCTRPFPAQVRESPYLSSPVRYIAENKTPPPAPDFGNGGWEPSNLLHVALILARSPSRTDILPPQYLFASFLSWLLDTVDKPLGEYCVFLHRVAQLHQTFSDFNSQEFCSGHATLMSSSGVNSERREVPHTT